MCHTCDNVTHMSRMIQIRNVPDGVHREIKARAARAGMTLSDYLKREVERLVATPTTEEILERIRARKRPVLSETPAEIIRAERDSR
jgi:antitoxin FitA